VAPTVPRWPGRPIEVRRDPGSSWPGAVTSASTGTGDALAGWPGAAAPSAGGPTDAGDGASDVRDLREPAHRVSPKATSMWMTAAAVLHLFPLGAMAAWLILDHSRRSIQWPVLAALLVLAVLHVGVSPFWRYRVHRWEVTDEAVYTQTGWFSQERRLAPISRIQTVDAQFGPIERLFGLGTLVVTTASAAGPLHIAGLERGTVERLVAELTRVAGLTTDDAT
jgi:uncharacterized protein